jgi:hypothetical protein
MNSIYKEQPFEREHRKDLAMTEPEGAPQDTDLAQEPSTDEATADDNQQAGEEEGADYQEEAKEGPTDDYQTRMEKFEEVEASVPVTSVPVESSGDLDKSDLQI